MKKIILAFGLMAMSVTSYGASDCYTSYVSKPTPMMGNVGEIVTLSDGTNWKVGLGEYNYLYQYYPNVSVCPSKGTITLPDSLNPKAISVSKVTTSTTTSLAPIVKTAAVTTTVARCDNSSVQGTYSVQWNGVKSGKSIVGNYQMYFDGTTASDGYGVATLGGYDSTNSYTTGKTGAFDMSYIDTSSKSQRYKVNDNGCDMSILATLPDGTAFYARVLLDLMDATTKPYRATHGTGFATVYDTPVTVNMTRWIK